MQSKQTSGPLLAVDDDDCYLFLLKMMHRKLKVDKPLILCESGQACLEYLDRVDKNEVEFPSVILMDINMPALTGLQTLESIRNRDGYGDVPVILMLSSSDDSRDREKAMRVGANGYINKSDGVLKKIMLGDLSV